MLKAGDVLENPVTGERAVVRVGSGESGGELLVADLYVRPGGAVMGEHFHPAMEESFAVVRGRLGYRLEGREDVAGPGERLHLPHGAVHDWWNAGEEEAQVLIEISPGARFEEMISNAFGLARDGKTDAKGQPHLLQAALFAREFDDVIRFTSPPRLVQKALFGALAPIARLLGYRGSYPKYLASPPSRPGGPGPRPVGVAADESRGEEVPEDEKARA
jgi:quercetin dioxygenase-like cupin family protein